MTPDPEIRDRLRRATGAIPVDVDRRLDELHARLTGQRRRQRLTALAVAAVIAIAAVGIPVVILSRHEPQPGSIHGGSFGAVRGWIALGGHGIIATDPGAPSEAATRLLTHDHGFRDEPIAWSNDGSQLLVNDGGGRWNAGDLFVVNSDGTQVRLTSHPSTYAGSFSPDGSQVVYGAACGCRGNLGSPLVSIYLVDAQGGTRQVLARGTGYRNSIHQGTAFFDPAWSPNGAQIAYVASSGFSTLHSGPSIWVMNADGTNRRRIVTAASLPRLRISHGSEPGLPGGLAWSPDSSRLAFSVLTSDNNASYTQAIVSVNADGSGLRQLTHRDGAYSSPSWSPDGSRIAFLGPFSPTHNPRSRGRAVFTMNTDGSDFQVLGSSRSLTWSDSLVWNPVPAPLAISRGVADLGGAGQSRHRNLGRRRHRLDVAPGRDSALSASSATEHVMARARRRWPHGLGGMREPSEPSAKSPSRSSCVESVGGSRV